MKTSTRRPVLALVLAMSLVILPAATHATGAVSTTIVISQIYGGGGNSGATYAHDFVELFNLGTATVSLEGWSIQYASATGTSNFGARTTQITPLTDSLAPGQYMLVQGASTAAVGSPLPTPVITDTTPIALSGTAGKVALVATADPLACNGGSTPCSSEQRALIVVLVGYGEANFSEGSAAPEPSNTTSISRAAGGCTDTDDNSADFAAGPPAPRNTVSPVTSCYIADAPPAVVSTVPVDGAAGVALDAGITITFSELVDATGPWFDLTCSASGAHAADVSGGPLIFVLDPQASFVDGDACTLTILAAMISDRDSNDPPDNMAADFVAGFGVSAPPPMKRTFIPYIQAAQAESGGDSPAALAGLI